MSDKKWDNRPKWEQPEITDWDDYDEDPNVRVIQCYPSHGGGGCYPSHGGGGCYPSHGGGGCYPSHGGGGCYPSHGGGGCYPSR